MDKQTIENQNAPKAIIFISNIVKNSETVFTNFNNNFLAFKTVNNLYLLIYIKQYQKSIISYDLINNKKINEIKNAHEDDISQLKNFYDKIENRDLMISTSLVKIKLWNISNMECLYNFINNKIEGFTFTACFLTYNNRNYIITTRDVEDASMKIYDFKGNLIKKIYYSSQKLFIDAFQDKKLSKNFIIFASNKDVKSYDINKNELFHVYSDYKKQKFNNQFKIVNVLINNEEDIVKLIFINSESLIRIFDFYAGTLLNIIDFTNRINDICLWNWQFLFIAQNINFLLFDLKNEEIVNEIKIAKKGNVINIKKLFLPKYGNCLILQYKKGIIKLFIVK